MKKPFAGWLEDRFNLPFFNLHFPIFNILIFYPVHRLPLVFASLSFLLSSCEFRSRRAAWHPAPGVTYKIRYSAETKAAAQGAWGRAPYVSTAKAEISAKAAVDSAKSQIDMSLWVDTLTFKAAERSPEEGAYMDGRLRKYRARLSLSRTGQALALEEEPALPPVDFSPLAIGRWLVYALPAFPDAPLRQGTRWDITQSLLDKFHPDSRVVKRYTLSAIRETPGGDLAVCLVELEAWLGGDLGGTPGEPALKGSGKVIFNLDKGVPESSVLELEGRFPGGPNPAPGDTAGPAPQPLEMREMVEMTFSD